LYSPDDPALSGLSGLINFRETGGRSFCFLRLIFEGYADSGFPHTARIFILFLNNHIFH